MKYLKIIKSYLFKHKVISLVLALVLVFVGYKGYQKITASGSQTKYVIAAVDKGTIVSTVTGTGQVSASNQLDLKSKASGDVVYIGAKVGQKVAKGTLIAQLDTTDAEISLKNAQIAYDKLVEPSDASTIAQSENSLADAKETSQKASDDLNKAYIDGFNDVVSANLDLPDIISGMNDLLYSRSGFLYDINIQSLNDTSKQYRQDAGEKFDQGKNAYNNNLLTYKNTNRNSSTSSIEKLISETYDSVKILSESIKDAQTAVNYINDQQDKKYNTDASSALSNLNSWTTQTNTILQNLRSIQNTISTDKDSIASANRNIIAKELSLKELKAGADSLDIASQKLSLQEKINSYNDYFIRAPFDGILAQLNIDKNVNVSNGTTVAVITTENQIAEVSLNEVDAAKVKVGQKATLTFDAVEDLTITGTVSSVDQVGTVSQGVVTYAVKINFDVQDSRIKPGMSVSADIAVDTRQDVVVVPSGAIKVNGDTHYVETFGSSTEVTDETGVAVSETPQQIIVAVGSSDDTNTEITSGLSVGDKIITGTVTSSATTQKTSSLTSLLGMGGRQGNKSSSSSSSSKSSTGSSKTTSSSQNSGAGGPPSGGPGF